MSEALVPVVADATVMPGASKLNHEEANALDCEIDRKLEACDQLLHAYVDAGQQLARMQETKGYAALGYRKWGDYLESKDRWGRTHLSYLLKLGRAGDATMFTELGMLPAVLIHYVKHVSYPEKVQDAIAATWSTVKDLKPKDAEVEIKKFVEDNDFDFKKPRKKQREMPPPFTPSGPVENEMPPTAVVTLKPDACEVTTVVNWESQFQKEYLDLEVEERKRFTTAMRDFLASWDDDGS
ncbi:MAG: hypothetical protein JWM80_3295 [Cyanobacteria bacterium RYN_339]|nr:hypothetical protein [Cyanobacteria bacterium RYN_339]